MKILNERFKNWDKSMLSSCNMIKKYNLSIFFVASIFRRVQEFNSFCSISRRVDTRIHIYNFSISSVSKKKPFVVVGVYSEIRGVI